MAFSCRLISERGKRDFKTTILKYIIEFNKINF